MKNKILIIAVFLISSVCFCQQKVTWKDLAEVKFSEKYLTDYDDIFLYPEFLPTVKSLEGKRITVKGYFLNISPEEKLYILSKGPMSSCFFCGAAGPETAVELQFVDKQNFKTDDIVRVTGRFKLNKDDIEHFNYILKDCKAILVE